MDDIGISNILVQEHGIGLIPTTNVGIDTSITN